MKKVLLLILPAVLLAAGPAFADPTPVKLSHVSRSFFYRDGKAWTGNAGFNGGSFSKDVFDGTYDNYTYQNGRGASLVIPTTDATTGDAKYVTDIVVGHAGNAKYSLYYTTEEAPDYSALQLKSEYIEDYKVTCYYYEVASDTRAWTPLDGATNIQAAGKKTYPVNTVATAVKYVFDTVVNWNQSLGEVEVWGVDPSEVSCMHEGFLTDWEEIPGTANCTEFGYEQCQCTNCGEWIRRETASALPLGHDYEAVLVERGTSLAFGSGTNVCKRCGDEVAFPEPRDLIAMGGAAAPGIIQFTDVSASSTGNPDYGVSVINLFDGLWHHNWSGQCPFWYAEGLDGEYVDYAFAAPVDLTAVDFSVHNHNHTIRFLSLEPDGSEVLVGEEAIVADTSANAAAYQRKTVEFRGVTLSTLRIRFDDQIGDTQFGKKRMLICELHPYGTVNGAGKSSAVRTRIIID